MHLTNICLCLYIKAGKANGIKGFKRRKCQWKSICIEAQIIYVELSIHFLPYPEFISECQTFRSPRKHPYIREEYFKFSRKTLKTTYIFLF